MVSGMDRGTGHRWQRAMIGLARSDRVTAAVQSRQLLAGLAARFVGGADLDEVMTVTQRLQDDGLATSLFVLGEYVEDPGLVATTVRTLQEAAAALARGGLGVHLSLDPTQAGLMTSVALCEANARTVAAAVRAAAQDGPRRGRDVLMLDMEDSGTTQQTLDLHDRMRQDGLPVAVTVQAYLHRTTGDLDRLAHAGAWVRLVKGALAEPAELAAQGRQDVDARFTDALVTLLSEEARAAGCYPSIATHDLRMIALASQLARDGGWGRQDFEFEMLYGVRADVQRELVRRGFRVRLYLPFGTAWFPYAIRRVGESPRNLRFALRAMAGGGL